MSVKQIIKQPLKAQVAITVSLLLISGVLLASSDKQSVHPVYTYSHRQIENPATTGAFASKSMKLQALLSFFAEIAESPHSRYLDREEPGSG